MSNILTEREELLQKRKFAMSLIKHTLAGFPDAGMQLRADAQHRTPDGGFTFTEKERDTITALAVAVTGLRNGKKIRELIAKIEGEV